MTYNSIAYHVTIDIDAFFKILLVILLTKIILVKLLTNILRYSNVKLSQISFLTRFSKCNILTISHFQWGLGHNEAFHFKPFNQVFLPLICWIF